MKKILLFGAGKSATVLIDYLLSESTTNQWMIIVADASQDLLDAKIGESIQARGIKINIENSQERGELIQDADIVISMMPPDLHILVARDCVQFGKNLLTASYTSDAIKELATEINAKQLLFLCEMGLDPGIDHMSAMRLIDQIRSKGGKIRSFKSHCGGLIAPESDDNPWHYKISWNPRNVVLAGNAGAEYKIENKIHHKEYLDLFYDCDQVNMDGLGKMAVYPNRDSLSYLPLYQLGNAETFIRTTIRYPSFCIGWLAIVQAGLTDDQTPLKTDQLTLKQWSSGITRFVNDSNKEMLSFLGLFDEAPVPSTAVTSADILQYLLETRLKMNPQDKDMIVMLHEIEYNIDDTTKKVESCLVVKGRDNLRTAMATTVGLPLGIAAKLILDKTIRLTGIHIPILKEIYEPVLAELEKAGIYFKETEQVLSEQK